MDICKQKHCQAREGEDHGGDMAAHTRTSLYAAATTSGQVMKPYCIVFYLSAAEQAGEEQHFEV